MGMHQEIWPMAVFKSYKDLKVQHLWAFVAAVGVSMQILSQHSKKQNTLETLVSSERMTEIFIANAEYSGQYAYMRV